jgi:hypothetical protein
MCDINQHRNILRRTALVALFSVSMVSGLNAQTTVAPRLFHNADGGVSGAVASLSETGGGALFTASSPSGPSSDTLTAFKAWVRSQTGLLRLAPMSDDKALSGLAPERDPVSQHEALAIHRFVQTYRGYPVLGPEERVSVVVSGDGRALAFAGTVLDGRINYAGLDRRIGESAAIRSILDAWAAQGRPGEPHVDGVSLMAVPVRRTLAYRGEVQIGEEIAAAVTVSAVDGSLLGFDDLRHATAFTHKTVRAKAYAMVDNPATTTIAAFSPLPGSTFGAICQPSPPGTGCILRMGNERAAVYDFELDNNSAPRIWTTIEFQPHPSLLLPWGWFLEDNQAAFQFKTQNVFQKMSAALAAGDAAKGGAGWDHHPNAPFNLFQAPPLSVFTNVDGTPEAGENNPCGGALGVTSLYTFTNAWAPVEHPYISNLFSSVAISLCSQDEAVLFHEMGHYYDMHSTFNVLGTGLISNTCQAGTTDEARPLRETVADLTALYFDKKLYAGLPFDLSTTPTPCVFTSVGQGTSHIHGGACTSSVGSFLIDRPAPSNIKACTPNQGYKILSLQQATWEYLSGRNCATTAPFLCAVSPANPDSFMEALLLAEGVSNVQSYEQFFEMMYLALWANEGIATADLFREIFSHHDVIQP